MKYWMWESMLLCVRHLAKCFSCIIFKWFILIAFWEKLIWNAEQCLQFEIYFYILTLSSKKRWLMLGFRIWVWVQVSVPLSTRFFFSLTDTSPFFSWYICQMSVSCILMIKCILLILFYFNDKTRDLKI